MFDKTARQEWLRENSERCTHIWKGFEEKPLSENFLARANLYDEPLVKKAQNDQELREAAAKCLKKKQQEDSQKYFALCYGYELEFILKSTDRKEAAENV